MCFVTHIYFIERSPVLLEVLLEDLRYYVMLTLYLTDALLEADPFYTS